MDQWEDYIENPEFVRWVFKPDEEINKYFEDFFISHPELKEKYLGIKKELQLLSMTPDQKITYERGAQLFQNITNKINIKKQETKFRHLRIFMRYAAIALFFLLIGSGSMYFISRNHAGSILSENLFLKSALYYPVIYFPDGTKKEIASKEKLIDLSLYGKIVLGTDTVKKENPIKGNQQSCVLVVPNGQNLKVILNDKSSVWLNAGSRLIFPSTFDTKKREVYISGEAFFDVAKNQHKPFIVNTSTIAVKVLGTKFNISSYPEDNEVVAALEEGKIRIIDPGSLIPEVKAELHPNQVACFNKINKQIKVTDTDHKIYTTWKEGFLFFEYQQIDKMIAKVERHYNIQIILKDPKKGKEIINGKMDLNVKMDEILEYITKITHAEIKKIDSKVYILK